MRIGIDARLNAYRRGGIPQYTQQLVAALAPQAPYDIFFTLQHREHHRPLAIASNVKRATLFTPPHHRLEQWSLPIETLPLRLDVLHCPDFIAPRYSLCPNVVTIHDLAFLRYPDILDESARRYYGQVRQSVQRAAAVIAVSQATRDDIVQLLDLPRERIDVVYEAAAPTYHPLDLPAETRREINGHILAADRFILFVSTIEPRKNLPTLFRALRICIDRRPNQAYLLALAGGRGWLDDDLFQMARDLRLEDHLAFLGNVSQDDLLWLYNACRLYVNPSLYEGFGLPVLEAMACGAPTIVAETSSLPEVAGEAAIMLPPLEVEVWAQTIERLWNDPDQRERLAQSGPQQAARFSWQETARQMLAIYRRIAR